MLIIIIIAVILSLAVSWFFSSNFSKKKYLFTFLLPFVSVIALVSFFEWLSTFVAGSLSLFEGGKEIFLMFVIPPVALFVFNFIFYLFSFSDLGTRKAVNFTISFLNFSFSFFYLIYLAIMVFGFFTFRVGII